MSASFDSNGVDSLSAIRLFLDAAALGSFSAAGRKQGLSPAAASASIQRLEAGLKTRLFERTTRQLRLTEEGRHYRHYSEQALALMAEAEAGLQAQGAVRGLVKISAPSDFGRNVLLGWLEAFRQRHPDVQYALSLSDSTSDLVQDDIDLAVRYGLLPDSDMVARPLLPNRRVVCAAPALLERCGVPEHPEQLDGLPALVLVTASGPMNEWRYMAGGARHTVRVQRSHQSNDGEVIRKWALAGQGFAYKSLLDIEDDLRAGRLHTVLDDYFRESVPLNLLYRRSRFQPPRIALLVDFLLERCAAAA